MSNEAQISQKRKLMEINLGRIASLLEGEIDSFLPERGYRLHVRAPYYEGKSTVWRCVSRVEKDGPDCSARTVHEELLHEVVVKAINEAFREKEDILPLLRGNIESSLEENAADRIAAVDEQIKVLQQELLATADMKNSGDDLGMEIRRLRDEKQAIQTEVASRQDLKTRIDEIMAFLDGLSCELTEYKEGYVRTLLEKITVYDDHIIVEFKSGIEIQIDE